MDLRELQKEYATVTEEKIKVGTLIETILGEEDGLVLNQKRKSKPKKLVITGVDKQANCCYGSVLVNTRISPKAKFSAEYLSSQYLIKQEDYPSFLKYDSYVDCGMLFSFPLDKLLKGTYFGELTEDDLANIFEILETTDTLSTKEKKRFGIRRR